MMYASAAFIYVTGLFVISVLFIGSEALPWWRSLVQGHSLITNVLLALGVLTIAFSSYRVAGLVMLRWLRQLRVCSNPLPSVAMQSRSHKWAMLSIWSGHTLLAFCLIATASAALALLPPLNGVAFAMGIALGLYGIGIAQIENAVAKGRDAEQSVQPDRREDAAPG